MPTEFITPQDGHEKQDSEHAATKRWLKEHAKMYRELNIEPSALAVAEHYRDISTVFVIDTVDEELRKSIDSLGIQVLVTNTLMRNLDDRKRLAQDVLNFTKRILE